MVRRAGRKLQINHLQKKRGLSFVLWFALWICISSVNAELVCHYKFDGNLFDSSSNAFPAGDGTLYGDAHYTSGKFGQALDFDGAGDFVKIMVSTGSASQWIPRTQVSNAMSITAWVKMDAYPTEDVDILASRRWQAGDNNFEFNAAVFGYDTPFLVVQQGTWLKEYPRKRIPPELLGQWVHLAITYDVIKGESYLYVNGVPGAAAPITSGAWVTIGNYSVGGNENLNARYFDGQIDDLRIYNHALSSQEVQAVYEEEVDLCGSWGYLPSDLNRDCYVTSEDVLLMIEDWMKSTTYNSTLESLPVPGTVLYESGQDIPGYELDIRQTFSLGGTWKLITEESIEMFHVTVPGVWQNQGPGMGFHGVGHYLRTFDLPFVPEGKRLWLHFENVATYAEVTLNGQLLGDHLGAWTPFEFDITDILQDSNRLQVKVDEKPGHFTAGFIPVIAGSFGGIWGDVWIETRPAAFVEDVFVETDVAGNTARAHVEIHNAAALPSGAIVEANVLTIPDGAVAGTVAINASGLDADGNGLVSVEVSNPKLWSPDHPNLYKMQVRIIDSEDIIIDQETLQFGMRDFKVQESKLVLNGSPVYIASALHWAIYPQYIAPSCTEAEFRQEVLALKALGFNAVNVCLFMFPERYYDIADEEGLILWQEYPYWNNFGNSPRPKTVAEKDAFIEEYKEMFRRDRRHTSVLLRSITLEDHDMDVPLIRAAFDLAHEMIPGSVVEDNSTELHQELFSDFVDHHPYVEVNLWKNEMAAWMNKVADTYSGKPFLFGEGLDFDTFRDTAGILAHYGEQRPWWTLIEHATGSVGVPGYLGPGDFWIQALKVERLISELGVEGVERIKENSYIHSMAARKYEVEQSRLYEGFVGMSLTCLRDCMVTRPGIYDDLGNLKFPVQALQRFNAQTIPLIDMNRQSRCYRSGELMTIDCYVSHYEPEDITGGVLRFELVSTDASRTFSSLAITKGTVPNVGQWKFSAPQVSIPTTFQLQASLTYGDKVSTNSWPIWIFPAKGREVSSNITLYDPEGTLSRLEIAGLRATQPVMITSSLDNTVINHLNSGGKVVLLDPSAAAFASHGSAFWREVAIERYEPGLFGTFPWEGAADVQFFDLTSHKAYDLDDTHTPLLRTINCRHLQQNDLIIKTNYGTGLLVATTLNLSGPNNVAGQCLLENIITYICE